MKIHYKDALLLFRHSDSLDFSIFSCSTYEQHALLLLESLHLVTNTYSEDQEVIHSELTSTGTYQVRMLFHRDASSIEKELFDFLGESLFQYDEKGNKLSSDTMVSFHTIDQEGQSIRKAKFSKSTGESYFMDMEFALELFKNKN